MLSQENAEFENPEFKQSSSHHSETNDTIVEFVKLKMPNSNQEIPTDVILIDTPGLNSTDNKDAENVKNMIQKLKMTHTVNIG